LPGEDVGAVDNVVAVEVGGQRRRRVVVADENVERFGADREGERAIGVEGLIVDGADRDPLGDVPVLRRERETCSIEGGGCAGSAEGERQIGGRRFVEDDVEPLDAELIYGRVAAGLVDKDLLRGADGRRIVDVFVSLMRNERC
jgi:hypothetical protein